MHVLFVHVFRYVYPSQYLITDNLGPQFLLELCRKSKTKYKFDCAFITIDTNLSRSNVFVYSDKKRFQMVRIGLVIFNILFLQSALRVVYTDCIN